MHYEVNVSRYGKHVFATAERSLQSKNEAAEAVVALRRAFPESEGYKLDVSRCGTCSEKLDVAVLLGEKPEPVVPPTVELSLTPEEAQALAQLLSVQSMNSITYAFNGGVGAEPHKSPPRDAEVERIFVPAYSVLQRLKQAGVKPF